MVKVERLFRMATYTWVTTSMVRKKVMGDMCIRMERYLQEDLRMDYDMVKGTINARIMSTEVSERVV